MEEFLLPDLPASVDLTYRSNLHWLPGREFNNSDWVVIDGHPYACDATHRATMLSRPGSGAQWQAYWTRVLWASARYRIGSPSLGFQEFVTDDSTPPIAHPIVSSSIKSVGGTTYVVLQADFGKILDFTSGSPVSVTLPLGLSADFVVGLSQGGVGTVTLVSDDDVFVNEPDQQFTTAARYVLLTLMAFSQDNYRLYGRTA